MSQYIRNFLRFALIVLLQVQILNKIIVLWWPEPSGFPLFIPMVYPLFILLMPFETPVWVLLISGFLLGLSIDVFMNTAGIHAFATVFIAYLRTNVLSALMPRNLNDYVNQSPGIKNMGWGPFLLYSAFLILLHHLLFFSLELWNFANMGYLLLKVVASAATTMLLVLVYLLLFTKQTANR